ncbi:DNA polymerase beta superfamily protein [uncultured Clostridium sp.]|uniref:DNA polymerase beta superfamily protein n=1 Tax=uncultured Clostridium sp. TaxID=59620 RepID=UPI0028E7EA18|nr:nucleotidyltransferase domain-containing protein [uncultured Clostridium sp.]
MVECSNEAYSKTELESKVIQFIKQVMYMYLEGRKEIFRALVGSYNYSLNTISSDKDYKVFVAPTFDDLYFNKQFSKSIIGELEDLDIHDIRKIPSLWWKSNINFMELLFSNEIIISPSIKEHTKEFLSEIFEMKDDIARMNLPQLYHTCMGMHLNKKKLIYKCTEGTQHLMDKYGYDTKQAMHSIRVLYFLKRFKENNFNDFKKSICYEEDREEKKFLLNVKDGCLSVEEYLEYTDKIFTWTKENLEQIYIIQNLREDVYIKLESIIKEIVKSEL